MKDAFDKLKDRMRAHESPIKLDDAWAQLQQAQHMQKQKSRRRIGLLLLLLLMGSCGAALWWLNLVSGMPVIAPAKGGNAAFEQVQQPVSENILSSARDRETIPAPPANISKEEQITNTDHEAIPQPQKYQMESVALPVSSENNPVITPEINHVNTTVTRLDLVEHTLQTVTNDEEGPDDDRQLPTNVISKTPLSAASSTAMPLEWLTVMPRLASSQQAPNRKEVAGLLQPLPNPSEITRVTKPRRWAVYAGGGMMLQQTTIEARTTEEESWAATRRQTERALPGFMTEIGLNYQLNTRLYLDGAFRYQQWYESFKYEYTQAKDYTLQQVLIKVVKYEPIGTEQQTYADTVVTGTQTVKITHYNPYSSASLRLGLGAQMWSWQRLGLDITAGLQLDIAQQASGKIAGLQQGIQDLTTADGYNSRVSFNTQLPVIYRLNKRWDLQLRPGFTTAILNDGARLKVGFRQGSGWLALRYKF